MADDVRQRIIESVFARLNAQGHQETYVSHVKIWEDAPDEGGNKSRYILIARSSDGSGYIHKAKRNHNGTFSVGKTWRLQELRGVEVVNPLAFNITLARTYRWQTESETEQANFVVALIRLFRSTNRNAPLQIAGIRDPDAGQVRQPTPQSYTRMERAPTPPNGVPLQATPRRPYMNGRSTEADSRQSQPEASAPVSPPPVPTPPRTAPISRPPRRAISPPAMRPESIDAGAMAYIATEMPERSETPPARPRPATPSSQSTAASPPPAPPPSALPAALRAGRARRPSNASSTARSFASAATAASQMPSIALPSSPDRAAVSTPPPVPQPPASAPPLPAALTPGSSRRPNGAAYPAPGNVSLEVPVAATPSYGSSAQSAYEATLEATPRPQGLVPPALRQRKSTIGLDAQLAQGRQPNARVSFFDPANQAALDRLLSGDLAFQDEWDEGAGDEVEVAEETARAMLSSVEEMLEGYEWASSDMLGSAGRGSINQIEARLIDELMALDKANIHSFIESDDRVNTVLQYLDDALKELDTLDSVISSYKIHLNAVNEDITFIQSQGSGLQVQTDNQRLLLHELEDMLQTADVDKKALLKLTQASLENNIEDLEDAATELYKALLSAKDRDNAATMERLAEYRAYNAQFCKRLYDFLRIMFTAQADLLLGNNKGVVRNSRGKPSLLDHKPLENYLGDYGGLLLYLKEMDEVTYGKLCGEYFLAASNLHSTQVKVFLAACTDMIKKTGEEDFEGFGVVSPTGTTGRAAAGVRRAGTIVRSPLEARRQQRERGDGDMRTSDVFAVVLEALGPAVYAEEEFIADFLQINNAAVTFADYRTLEQYFRRQAARSAGLSANTLKLVRGAMDLIFAFLPAELKTWLDNALAKDKLQIVGMIVCVERFLTEAEERGNAFFLGLLEKQHVRLKGLFERQVADFLKEIGQTNLTSKKRNGVATFIKAFPSYVGRVETQLIGADTLEVRQVVDVSYDRIVEAMFAALKQMAKMDGEGEDKGQLNYHVILIENMHYFVAEMAQLDIGSVASFLQRAQAIYDENLVAYTKLVLRRPFSKILEYFEGVERLLKTTAPTEVASNSSYSKSSVRKVIKEYNTKDLQKHVNALFKRVEKHFTEASDIATSEQVSSSTGIASGTVLVGVWKACEEELLRMTEFFNRKLAQCYANTGVALEYTQSDVEAAFKRHRIAS
ncbi:exocyst complex component Sec3-domain-containing protein [Phanerochaete sordida]|uniref:Exocyst complex component Sec3-domain-containing protein n=1 Tax=Phanerochaete sordida TaxID=48140 RepID=A0A9P3GKA5_9APHY|nr:exocyst complex component Sec3-domain-containing protein [Phanerochaete sordida]